MKKNVVFLTSVKFHLHEQKFGGYEWMDISKATWKSWCERNDCILYVYDKPSQVKMGMEYRVTWQRWFDVFDKLEEAGIDYDKVFVVDSTSMVRWDCPNFFDLCDDRITAWRDMANLNWIYHSVQGYKDMFDDFELDISKYINCGSVIINESHKEFLNQVKEFYDINKNKLILKQDTLVKKGTDQTPFNYLLQKNNIDVNIDLPRAFNVNHLQRGDWLSHNWQDGNDTTPFFLKYIYIWRATGIPKNQRTSFMLPVWDMTKHLYVNDETEMLLSSVKHKDTFKNATTKKFKKEILDYFKESGKDMSLLEFGCCHGDTSKIFSKVFKKVYATDWKQSNIDYAVEKCKDCSNVELSVFETGKDSFHFDKSMNVIFVDARHDYQGCLEDLRDVLTYFDNPIIVMDDYGTPSAGVRSAIDEILRTTDLEILKHIGESEGYLTAGGWKMNDREGVIMGIQK